MLKYIYGPIGPTYCMSVWTLVINPVNSNQGSFIRIFLVIAKIQIKKIKLKYGKNNANK